MSKNFEEAIRQAFNRLKLTPVYQNKMLESIMKLEGIEAIDAEKFEIWFCNWLQNKDVTKISSLGGYFMKAFVEEFKKRTFTSDTNVNTPAASTPQTAEEFEASWEAWKETLRDLQEDFYEEEYPSRGVLSHDKNTNEVRAVSDGEGGLIYIDGTVSGKYPRLEELPPEEQEQLILQVKNLHGSLLGLENVIRRMKEHAEACNY